MSSEALSSNPSRNSLLTGDQQHACARLVAAAHARATLPAILAPVGLPTRWSVPVLSGPTGSGKTHVCQEVARRLGDLPCERWEVGSWAPAGFRTNGKTLDQLHAFMGRHPEGSVVYLAGVEALITKYELSLGSYGAVVLDELVEFLGQATVRSPSFRKRDNNLLHARVLVVVGGSFEPFGNDPTMRDAERDDWWKFADQPEYSSLPARLRSQLSSCPLVLNPMHRQEAMTVAARLLACLPAAMDGIDAAEIADALQGPRGWHALTEVFEQSFVAGHTDLLADRPVFAEPPSKVGQEPAPGSSPVPPVVPAPAPTTAVLSKTFPLRPLIEPKERPSQTQFQVRLAQRFDFVEHTNLLLGRLRRLGLTTATHLEALAAARGYTLPGEGPETQRIFLPGAWREQLSDCGLAAALLSPALEYSVSAICRGAYMVLRLCQTGLQYQVADAAHCEHADRVFHHVARLALREDPHADHWLKLVEALQMMAGKIVVLPVETMPDFDILEMFTAVKEAGN